MARVLLGVVGSYDERRGLGLLEHDGRQHPFHCTAISDGSRRIEAGAAVSFVLGPSHGGRHEAVSVTKLAAERVRPSVAVRPVRGDEREFVTATLEQRWGGEVVVARGFPVHADALEALVAVLDSGERAGLLTYRVDHNSLEVVTLDAFVPGEGVGSALLEAAGEVARKAGLWRLFLVTTTDNLRAIGFYLTRGLRIATVHQNAVTFAREIKPSIPVIGHFGIPLQDEVEFELVLGGEGPPPRAG